MDDMVAENSSNKQAVTDYTLTNLPDGTFLAPFSYQELAKRDYEGFLPGLFLRKVVITMLRKHKTPMAAAIDQDTAPIRAAIITVVGLLLLAAGLIVVGQVAVVNAQKEFSATTNAIIDALLYLLVLMVGWFSGLFKWIRNTYLLPKETHKELNRDYVEANLDALVPGTGDLPPTFVQVLRQDTPSYGSRDKTIQSIEEMREREQKGNDIWESRKFPHHLEFLFSHSFPRPNSYPDYPLMDGQKVDINVDEDGQKWAWHMIGIWSLLPPKPELNGAWGTSEENKKRIQTYNVFAKSVLAHSVFDAIHCHDFDHSRIPPSRLKRMIEAFGILSGDDETPRFDSSKVDEFITQMSQGDANEDLPTILEIMAEDLSSKS